jgi:hypothetical protein
MYRIFCSSFVVVTSFYYGVVPPYSFEQGIFYWSVLLILKVVSSENKDGSTKVPIVVLAWVRDAIHINTSMQLVLNMLLATTAKLTGEIWTKSEARRIRFRPLLILSCLLRCANIIDVANLTRLKAKRGE